MVMTLSDDEFHDKYGPWAFIAGASDGTGAAFARELAAKGLNVVLAARSRDKLEALAEDIRTQYKVEARALVLDLTAVDLADVVKMGTHHLEVGLLVYVTGSPNTTYERLLDQSEEHVLRMVRLNCVGPARLAMYFGRGMRDRGRGGMMFLTSMAALAGSSYQTIYSATKAFDHIFAESLWHDLHPYGIDVMSLFVGATRTDKSDQLHIDFDKYSEVMAGHTAMVNFDGKLPKDAIMAPEEVVREGLENLGRTPVWIAGEFNRNQFASAMTTDRVKAIEAASAGAAVLNNLDYLPVKKD